MFTFDKSSNTESWSKKEQGEAHGGSSARNGSNLNLEQNAEQLLDERANRNRALTAEQVGQDTICGNLIASSALRVQFQDYSS